MVDTPMYEKYAKKNKFFAQQQFSKINSIIGGEAGHMTLAGQVIELLFIYFYFLF